MPRLQALSTVLPAQPALPVHGGGNRGVRRRQHGQVLQPLVFDPLRRLQGNSDADEIDDADRLWVAVDGMGGDHAPGPILEGCLEAIDRLPLKVRFVGETDQGWRPPDALGLREA